MSWNYRVIWFESSIGPYCAVHEVYYEGEDKPVGYAAEPAVVLWEPDDGDPTEILNKFREALAKPYLREEDFFH